MIKPVADIAVIGLAIMYQTLILNDYGFVFCTFCILSALFTLLYIMRSFFGVSINNLPTAQAVQDFCYYIEECDRRDCVICLEKDLFCTFRHGSHKNFNLGEMVTIYNYNGTRSYITRVRFICERLDFIILKSSEKMEKVPALSHDYFPPEPLLVCGRSDITGEITYSSGSIRTSLLQYFSDGRVEEGPFLLGDIHTLLGDSGGAVFSANGLIGMHVRVTPCYYQLCSDVIYNAAHFKVENCIVRISDLLRGVNVVKMIDSPPRPKDHPQPHFLEYEGKMLMGS
ncbi:unnamed protein product [Meloidogyne enterolobii]|uniref:Uncharacterized protein n=1 Tax=Meloidogyne enterolobii TaxID=390850 RepID=A0ACB1AZJ5_MELEN